MSKTEGMIVSIVPKDLEGSKMADEDKAMKFLRSSKIPKKCSIHGDSSCSDCQHNAQIFKSSHNTDQHQRFIKQYNSQSNLILPLGDANSMNAAVQLPSGNVQQPQQQRRPSISIMTSLIDRIKEIDEQNTLLRELNGATGENGHASPESANHGNTSNDSLTVSTNYTELSNSGGDSANAEADNDGSGNRAAKRVRFDEEAENETKKLQVSHSSLLYHFTGTNLLSKIPKSSFEHLTDDKSADRLAIKFNRDKFCRPTEFSENIIASKLILSMFSSTNFSDFEAISEIIHQSSFKFTQESQIDKSIVKLIVLLASKFRTAINSNTAEVDSCKCDDFHNKMRILLSYLDIHLKHYVDEYDLLLLYKIFKNLIVLSFDEFIKKDFEVTINSICITLLRYIIEVDIDFVSSIEDLSSRELHIVIQQLLQIVQSKNKTNNFAMLRNIMCQISFKIIDSNISQSSEPTDLNYYKTTNKDRNYTDKTISKSIVSALKMIYSNMFVLKNDIFFVFTSLSTLLVLFMLVCSPTDKFLQQVHQLFMNIDSRIHDTNKSIDNTLTKDMLFSFNFMIENTFSLFSIKKNYFFTEHKNKEGNVKPQELNPKQQQCYLSINTQMQPNDDNEDDLPSI